MTKEYIRNRIANIRISKNISARKLSLELGMSSEYVNQVENGRLTPSLDFILNFCDYFGLSVSEFFNQTNVFPLEYKELLSELNKLTPDELSQIINIIKLINKNK